MKLYVIFGRRKERQFEMYAPEALAVMDEYSRDENPEWLRDRIEEFRKDSVYVAVAISEIQLESGAMKAIRNRLMGMPKVRGTLTEEDAKA